MREIFEQMIAAGIRAPSGDNCQPWRFAISGKNLDIYNLPERDHSLYSWGQRASYVAHGALLENMSITAAHLGYRIRVQLFPGQSDDHRVARVRIEPSGQSGDPLYPAIARRTTNRKPYRASTLNEEQRTGLLAVSKEVGAGQILLAESVADRKLLGRVASTNETILFENRDMHSFFFGHLNWTAEEDSQNRKGMFIGTLELPPPVQLGFKVFRRWNALQALNKIGLSKFVAVGNGQLYSTGAAIGAIVIDDRSPESYIKAGRLLERVWLKVTAMDWHLQPLTGIMFLMNRIVAGQAGELSGSHAELISNTYRRAADILGVPENKAIAMMFRIGQADAPGGRTSRLDPDIA